MSENKHLATRAAYLLAYYAGGQVARTSSGPFENPEALIPEMGRDFNLEAAFARFHNSPFQQSTLENPYPNLAPGQRPKTMHGLWWREWLWNLALRVLRIISKP